MKRPEVRAKMGKTKIGNEYLAENWLIIKPDGTEIEIKNLTKYCKENNLTQSAMWKVSKGNRAHHKQYKCKKLEKQYGI